MEDRGTMGDETTTEPSAGLDERPAIEAVMSLTAALPLPPLDLAGLAFESALVAAALLSGALALAFSSATRFLSASKTLGL